jgi:alkanesulfonate monooxygenase SsuD/methylene tetrahydromethanopterin reductase-like flavin-dependent oxidoreductase (luciferase family)
MMHIGMSLSPFGHHPAAWRGKDAAPNALDVRHFAAQAQIADTAALDFVFFADAPARPLHDLSPLVTPFEPTTLAAALATVARRIGLVATAATGQHELYNLARRFASLDLISRGRAGWNWVASGPTDAWNEEYVAVVSALWRSWDADAFVYDKAAGRFFMPDKMHVLQHRGAHFTVRGPLNVNPSPQGAPVITTVLTPETRDLAARSAEVMFVACASPQAAAALLAPVADLLAAQGRERSEVRVLANVVPWIGTTRAQARDAFDELGASSEKPAAWDVIGTEIDIADALQEWFERREVDGFTILPPVMPTGLDAFIGSVLPELRRRGLFRAGYEGTTLRDHLALDGSRRPAVPA